MIGTLLAVPALGVAVLAGLALMAIGLSSESGRDGGRAIAAFLAGVPFALAVLADGGVALARGGFDWIGLPRPARPSPAWTATPRPNRPRWTSRATRLRAPPSGAPGPCLTDGCANTDSQRAAPMPNKRNMHARNLKHT
jgi:hypothetical protein